MGRGVSRNGSSSTEVSETVAPKAHTSRTDPRVNSLRLLFRTLMLLQSRNEAEGIDEIVCPNGAVWSLYDIEYWYQQAMRRPTGNLAYDREHPTLPLRQQQAIQLFLVMGVPEEQAALIMGLKQTNPIGMYATSGLTKLLRFYDEGRLRHFKPDSDNMLAIA
jgi:hypothetical protein